MGNQIPKNNYHSSWMEIIINDFSQIHTIICIFQKMYQFPVRYIFSFWYIVTMIVHLGMNPSKCTNYLSLINRIPVPHFGGTKMRRGTLCQIKQKLKSVRFEIFMSKYTCLSNVLNRIKSICKYYIASSQCKIFSCSMITRVSFVKTEEA
jgi:hypothetical protein